MNCMHKISIIGVAFAATMLSSCHKAAPMPAQGAVATGVYHNLFTEVCGIPEEEVLARTDSLWEYFFTPGDFSDYINGTSVYYNDGDSLAFVYDTGSGDVRTEGMSYGMMISVQLNHREEFDKLWRWSKKHMAFEDPDMDGYFCWHCTADGEKLPGHNASDGEIYYATALFMAANRWNEPSYAEEARQLLRKFCDKDPATGIYPLYDKETKRPCFVPNEEVHWFSDPSYALPAFLEIWKERADTNQIYWGEVAQANRDLLVDASHPVTGLYPDYCLMDGTPYLWQKAGYPTDWFFYDAVRCAMNIGMDSHWYGKDTERQREIIRRLLKFFKESNYTNAHFSLDGTQTDDEEITESTFGANAVGCFALLDSEDPNDRELVKEAVMKFWEQPFPSGQWRYYNGLVYMLAYLHASGQFKAY